MSKIKHIIKRAASLVTSREAVRYLVFGVLTTAVSFGSYALFRVLWGENISILGSVTALPNVCSWVLAVTFAYVTNRRFVFESRSSGKGILREIGLFVGARLLSLVVDTAFCYLLLDLPKWYAPTWEILVKCADAVIIVVLNYVLSKLLVFKKNNNPD
ncbi:MAG: GtrA family protein [Oscillospiraceae bacterium]|nr:GtrA family protein [Oscillospiraceae bacterium]